MVVHIRVFGVRSVAYREISHALLRAEKPAQRGIDVLGALASGLGHPSTPPASGSSV
jgi:hypothetical protein